MFKRLLYYNFKIVYRVSHWLRHRFTPAGLLILCGIIASGVFGINTRQTLAFQVFSLSASFLLVALLSAITFRSKFNISRKLPDFGSVSHPLKYQVQIENTNTTQQRDLILIDELQNAFPTFDEFLLTRDDQDRNRNWFDRKVGYPRLMNLLLNKRGASMKPIEVKQIPPSEKVELNIELMPIRRGYLHFFRSVIGRPDPFGLFRALTSSVSHDSLLILPRIYKVPPIRLEGKRKYQQGGMNLASQIGDSQEFISLRDYKPGDPLRAIHWRSYAKLGKPVVKEFQDEFFVRQGLVLDTFIEDKSDRVFENAVSIAASYSSSLHEQDSLLDLMFVGTEAFHFTSGRGLGKSENMLEILACVSPCRNQSFQHLSSLLYQHLANLSGLIFVLLDWDKKRQDLIRDFIMSDIPVFIFIITEAEKPDYPEPGPMQDCPERFVVLNSENIQQQLEQLM